MAIQNQPSRISEPFAGSGTKNVIPATNATPSASQAASWASGFPPECSQPISAGGCPVPRNDMNGVLNWLSQGFAFKQDGGIWEWSALADYDVQRMVRGSDGLLYWSVAQSGPGVAAGAQDPTADTAHSYWGPAPMVSPFVLDDSSNAATTEWVRDAIEAATIFVDGVNGNDANDGLTSGTAVKTIAQALSLGAKRTGFFATIVVAAGTYHEDISISATNVLFNLLGDVYIDSLQVTYGSSVNIYKDSIAPTATLFVSSSNKTSVTVSHNSILSVYLPVEVTAVTSYDCLAVTLRSAALFNSATTMTCNGAAHVVQVQINSFCRFMDGVTVSGTAVSGNAIFIGGKSYFRIDGGYSSSNIVTGSALIASEESTCIFSGGNYTFYGASTALFSLDGNCNCTLYGSGNMSFNSSGGTGSTILNVSGCSSFRNECTGTVAFSGANQQTSLIRISDNSDVYVGSKVSFSGSVTDGTFSMAINSSAYIATSATISGTVTGKRFAVRSGSQLDVGGAGASRIPGSAAGAADATRFAYYG